MKLSSAEGSVSQAALFWLHAVLQGVLACVQDDTSVHSVPWQLHPGQEFELQLGQLIQNFFLNGLQFRMDPAVPMRKPIQDRGSRGNTKN